MYWLSRPPLLRYVLASLLVLAGLAVEMRPQETVPYPFAAGMLLPGTAIEESNVDFREVPAGIFPTVSLPATARVRIEAGQPLTGAVLTSEDFDVPENWWSLEMPLPGSAVPGDEVLLIYDQGHGATGRVVSLSARDDYTGEVEGLVAMPLENATGVSLALMEGRLAVLLGR